MLKSPIPCENPAMTKTEAKPVSEIVNELFSKSPDGLRELVRAVMQEDARSRDDGRAWGGEGRALSRPARLPLRLLLAHSHHSCGQARTARTARPGRALLDWSSSSVISAPNRRARGDFGRDVRAGRSRPGRSRRSPRNSAAIPSRPPPFPRSTSVWTKPSRSFAGRPLEEPFAYLILDARYEKVREGGVVDEPVRC